MVKDHDYAMLEDTVLISHNCIITEKFPEISEYTDFSGQKISETSPLFEYEIISRSLIRESF